MSTPVQNATATDGTSTVVIPPQPGKSWQRSPKEPKTKLYRRYDPRTRWRKLPGGGFISRNAACPCGSGKRYKRCCQIGFERRKEILSRVSTNGLEPGHYRLEECQVCHGASFRSLVGQQRHVTSLKRMCPKCRQERHFICVDVELEREFVPTAPPEAAQ